MVRRSLFLALLAGALSGCNQTTKHGLVGEGPRLQAAPTENAGIAILHTSLHDENCHTIVAGLAQPDGSGRFVHVRDVPLKGPYDFQYPFQRIPNRIALAPGEYGIVSLRCTTRSDVRSFGAPAVQRASAFDGTAATYARAMATFHVKPREVVDIGSMLVPKRVAHRRGEDNVEGTFILHVAPIPERWLRNLANSKPDLYNARVIRPMVPRRSREGARA